MEVKKPYWNRHILMTSSSFNISPVNASSDLAETIIMSTSLMLFEVGKKKMFLINFNPILLSVNEQRGVKCKEKYSRGIYFLICHRTHNIKFTIRTMQIQEYFSIAVKIYDLAWVPIVRPIFRWSPKSPFVVLIEIESIHRPPPCSSSKTIHSKCTSYATYLIIIQQHKRAARTVPDHSIIKASH